MTYPMTGGPGPGPGPGSGPGSGPGVYPPQPPWNPPTGPPPQPPRRTATRLALAAAILAAALGGGIIGSLLTRTDTSATPPTAAARETPTPEDVRAQDVKLCTEYALINVARPQPATSSRDLFPVAAAVRTSLATYPDANADIRSALSDVVDTYFAEMADFEKRGAKGLVDPPRYDEAAAQATYDRAWAICGLK